MEMKTTQVDQQVLGSETRRALMTLTGAPSARLAVGLAVILIAPLALTLGVVKPLFGVLFAEDPIARKVRYALQALLLLGIPGLVIWRMRLFERRMRHAALTRIVVGAMALLIVVPAILHVFLRPLLGVLIPDTELAKMLAELLMIPGILMGYALVFRSYEKREIHELSRGGSLRELGVGFGMGIALPSLTFLLLHLSGYYVVLSVNQVSVLVFAFVSLMFISLQEELFFRGVAFRITEEHLGTRLAIGISAFVFSSAHLTNENVTLMGLVSAALGGALLGVLFSLTRRLWLPAGFHFAWNLCQVFFGSSVSGVDEFGGFLQSRLEGPRLLTGGAFGIESSLPLLAGLSVLTFVLYQRAVRSGRIVGPSWRVTEIDGLPG
jgi:CAAX protease family protein